MWRVAALRLYHGRTGCLLYFNYCHDWYGPWLTMLWWCVTQIRRIWCLIQGEHLVPVGVCKPFKISWSLKKTTVFELQAIWHNCSKWPKNDWTLSRHQSIPQTSKAMDTRTCISVQCCIWWKLDIISTGSMDVLAVWCMGLISRQEAQGPWRSAWSLAS